MAAMRLIALLAFFALVSAQESSFPPPSTPPPSPPPPPPICDEDYGCANDAVCSADLNSCNCTTAPFTFGTYCQSCTYNRSPAKNCKKVIDPCLSCPDTARTKDECMPSTNYCPVGASCSFVREGKAKCACPTKGYKVKKNAQYPMGICVDVNECLYPGKCPRYSHCKNTPGDYTCTCKAGYKPVLLPSGRVKRCVKA